MTSNVLLVEDYEVFDRQFREIFGNFDRFGSAEDLTKSQMRGWSYAFVDFDLEGEQSGLSVLEYLRVYSPDTKVIIFTALTENGRGLFALAARHWYNVWAVRDKRDCKDEVLVAMRDEGRNPTEDGAADLLKEQAWRIDTLFPLAHSVGVWGVWVEFGGSTRGIAQSVESWGLTDMDRFSADTTAAVGELRQKCSAWLTAKNNFNAQQPLRNQNATTTFVEANSKFFYAPDLEQAVNRVRPWTNATASEFWKSERDARRKRNKERKSRRRQ